MEQRVWYLEGRKDVRDEMQMKRASEDEETVRARKGSIENEAIES